LGTALDVDLVAPATLTFALLPAMLDPRWGRVVNLSGGGVDGPRATLRANAFVTSKTALEAHTVNLAAEPASSGVTVNVLRPGSVRTDMFGYLQDHPRTSAPRSARVGRSLLSGR
jgi:3-oxoacyl-[acyl-carrier protein] reductase